MPDLRPRDIAERLVVNVDRVLGWINSGQLAAVNVGDGRHRPRWRITEDDLQTFLSGRRNTAATVPPAPRRRRMSAQAAVIEFF